MFSEYFEDDCRSNIKILNTQMTADASLSIDMTLIYLCYRPIFAEILFMTLVQINTFGTSCPPLTFD